MTRLIWQEQEIEFIRQNARGLSRQQIADALSERFGVERTAKQVNFCMYKHGIRSGTVGKLHELPTGSESAHKKGPGGGAFVKVKTDDGWVLKHHVIWEEEHGATVPNGCRIMFADRDRTNFDPANLVAVPRRMVAVVNRLPYHDAESLKACMALAELKMGVNKRNNVIGRPSRQKDGDHA